MAGMLKQVELDKDVYTLALERAHAILDRFDRVAVMFSGGKDSTATLHVMLDAAASHPRHARHLPMRAIFFDEEAIPQETADYVERVFARDDVAGEWYCLPVKHRNACSRRSPWWWPWAPEDRDKWCRPLPEQAITELDGFKVDPPEGRMSIPDANGLFFDPADGEACMVMGIRAQESLTRRRAVTRKKGDNYLTEYVGMTKRGNLWKGYPIYDWTTEDVWTAPATLGWDYNRAYDHLAMAGISPAMQRCSPAFGEEPLQKIHTYASCFPEVWDKMVDRVPGVGAAARYALTELYSYHGRPEKPAGMTWPEFIKHYLPKFQPKDQRFIAKRISSEIKLHYKATSDPIAADAPHPDTGISWDWLLMLAMRGDFKGRKQAGGRIVTMNDGTRRALPKYWTRYAKSLQRSIDEGTTAELAYPGRRFPTDAWALVPAYARQETETDDLDDE